MLSSDSSAADSLRPWLRRVWWTVGGSLLATAVAFVGMLARGGHWAVDLLFVAAPVLTVASGVLAGLGIVARLRAGGGHGLGLAILVGLVLMVVGAACSLLAFAAASAVGMHG